MEEDSQRSKNQRDTSEDKVYYRNLQNLSEINSQELINFEKTESRQFVMQDYSLETSSYSGT